METHKDAVSCMDWHTGVLATGSWDSGVKLWHCNEVNGYNVRPDSDSDLIAELKHSSPVTCLHISPDKSQLVSGKALDFFLWLMIFPREEMK